MLKLIYIVVLIVFCFRHLHISPWSKLYKRSIIKEHRLRFCEGMHIGEDAVFYIHICCTQIKFIYQMIRIIAILLTTKVL